MNSSDKEGKAKRSYLAFGKMVINRLDINIKEPEDHNYLLLFISPLHKKIIDIMYFRWQLDGMVIK